MAAAGVDVADGEVGGFGFLSAAAAGATVWTTLLLLQLLSLQLFRGGDWLAFSWLVDDIDGFTVPAGGKNKKIDEIVG